MRLKLKFRIGQETDSTQLALVLDSAGRRLPSYLWGQFAEPGQSVFEYGREKIRTDIIRKSFHKNWYVAETQNNFVGAFFGFLVEKPYPEIDFDTLPKCMHPIIELEQLASGSWLLQALAILPEYRGNGFVRQLLDKAELVAQEAGAAQITLQVGEINKLAVNIYQMNRYFELARRPYRSFPGSHDFGDYILMSKQLI